MNNNKKTLESRQPTNSNEYGDDSQDKSRTGRVIAGFALAGTLVAGVTACGSETSGGSNGEGVGSTGSVSTEVIYDGECYNAPGASLLGNIDLTNNRWRVEAQGMTGNALQEYRETNPLSDEAATDNWKNIDLIREDRERLLIDEKYYNGSSPDEITNDQINQIVESFEQSDNYAYYQDNPGYIGEVAPMLFGYNQDGTSVEQTNEEDSTPLNKMNFCIGG